MEKRITYGNTLQLLRTAAPRIHCLTNAVTMNDVANVLLAIGGSAMMAQDAAEAEEITALCHGTLLNTGTPDIAKFTVCELAGKQANRLKHPVVLDPVGAGASQFRREYLAHLLKEVQPSLIRCNLEEAATLFQILSNSTERDMPPTHGGVESGITADNSTRIFLAADLAQICRATVLISGPCDAISDGKNTYLVHGGDMRITRITGSGCMLSALCAAFLASGLPGCQAACTASQVWKYAAIEAGRKTDSASAGIGSFHVFLLDTIQTMEGIPGKIVNSIQKPADSWADVEKKEAEKGDVTIEDFTGNIPSLRGI